jgi:HEPN domain-containing protein
MLNKAYIETRYPADMPSALTLKELDEAIKTARKLFKFVAVRTLDEIEITEFVVSAEESV